MLENYKCVIASKSQIIEKWDEEIKKHNYSEEWKIYKEQSLSNMDTRTVYMGLLDGIIITEATAIISGKDKCIENKDDLVDNGKVSKLYKFMENDLKSKGFKSLTLGVEPKEIRNIQIYFNWGFTKYIKTGFCKYANGEVAIVNYYEKELN